MIRVNYTLGSLTNAVGAMYAKKYFPADQKAVADEMVENIRWVMESFFLRIFDSIYCGFSGWKKILDCKYILQVYVRLNLRL